MAVTKKTEKNMIEELFSVGAHFGYTKSRRHPTVKPFIFGNKNKVELFDLEKTEALLQDAKAYMKELGEKGSTVVFIGGKNESIDAVRKGAESINMPFVVGRWIGGTFTNFTQIRKRVEKLINYKESREKGDFAKYTKWERVQIDREVEKLERFFGGIEGLTKLPEAIFVVDTKREHIAVAEANQRKIKVIGLLGSDCNMKDADYPILGNDSSKKSIEFYVNEMVASYKEGKENAPKKDAKATE